MSRIWASDEWVEYLRGTRVPITRGHHNERMMPSYVTALIPNMRTGGWWGSPYALSEVGIRVLNACADTPTAAQRFVTILSLMEDRGSLQGAKYDTAVLTVLEQALAEMPEVLCPTCGRAL